MPKKPHYAIFFSTYLAQDVDEKHPGEKVLDCPFHDCENPTDHFYANCDTGEWHCKRCDKSGNARTLLTLLHAQYYLTTTKNQYLSLSEVRGLSVETLRSVAKLAYDTDNDRWLVPYFTYNPDTRSYSKYLNNLGYFYPSSRNENRYTIKKASALSLYLYDPGNHPCPPSNEAIICEGEWDTWAYIEAHRESEDMILGKPGAGFSLAMLHTLKKIDSVTLLLDNDDAGRKQTASTVNTIQTQIKNIKTIDWVLVEDAPKDIRALWMKIGVDMPSVISDAIVPYNVEPEERREILGSYQTCLSDYPIVPDFTTYLGTTSKFLYLPDETKLAMAATLGITSSITIPGEPLWAFLIGPPSCLDGDTIVKVNRAGKTFDISMEDLHYMFNGGRRGGKVWKQRIPTKIQRREDDGTIRLVEIHQVIHSGRKVCYEVVTETGQKIVATKDHKFLTQDGWKTLSKLTIKDRLFVNNGSRGINAQGAKAKNQNYVYGLKYHPYATQPCQGNRHKSRGRDRVLQHRLVYEAYLNDISYDMYIYTLRHSAEHNFEFLEPEQVVHHKDGDHNNHSLDNLQLTNRKEHGKLHGKENISNVAETTELSKIISITKVGERETYDLTVADDPHNFIAEGIVVHNCGKTTFIDSFGGNNELFDNLSKISAKALVSGWKDETGEEPSYLKKLRDKTLFVKDFTVTLTDSPDSQREVFGLLTDIFDGYVKIPYGNNEVKEFYDLYFNMVAGVTDIVHKHSAASIGERFLRIDYLGRKYDAREFARRAVANFGLAKSQKTTLVANTLGFINHLRSLPINMEIDAIYQEPITDLAEFIATIRTKVEADKEGIQYRPRTELPSRLAFTLCKLFVSVRNVYIQNPDRDEDKEIASALAFEVVKKVSLDTCYGFPLDIIRTLQHNPSMTKQQLADKAKIHSQRAYRVLADLITTGVITTTDGRVGARGGRPLHHYAINPKLLSVLDYNPAPILPSPKKIPKKGPPKKVPTKGTTTKKGPSPKRKEEINASTSKATTKRPKPKRPPNRS